MDLVLITSTYPYDKGEEFLENEVPYLSLSFDRIFVVPTRLKAHSAQTRNLPDNFIVLGNFARKNRPLARVFFLLLHLRFVFREFSRKSNFSIEKLNYFSFSLDNALRLRAYFNSSVKRFNIKYYSIYSYWFTSDLLAFKKDTGRIYTRLHRGDLYEEMNYIPFRHLLFENIDLLCPISDHGKDYLQSHFKIDSSKINVFRLGVEDNGYLDSVKGQTGFTVISVSYCVEVKKVHIIIDALAHFRNDNIRWVHIGGGPLLEKLKKEAEQRLKIDFTFVGNIPNCQLKEIYFNYKPDLFISCSASEGIPVSMMESISYGVPILATDVGGVSELVNDRTGFLMPADITSKDVYHELSSIISQNKHSNKRKSAREFFYDNYYSKKNFTNFIEKVLK